MEFKREGGWSRRVTDLIGAREERKKGKKERDRNKILFEKKFSSLVKRSRVVIEIFSLIV